MNNLYTFIDNLIAETIKSRVVLEEEDVDFDAHVFDPLIMKNWEKMRVRAINHGLFDEKDCQKSLYEKLSTTLENIEIPSILADIKRFFVESNQKDAFEDEYAKPGVLGIPRPTYYQPVNALEFWLIMIGYLKHHKKSDDEINGALSIAADLVHTRGGYVANLFYSVYQNTKNIQAIKTNNVNAISVIAPEDIQKNKSLEIVKGALSLAGIICGSLLLAGVITFPIASFALMLIGGCLISIGGLYSAYKLSETFAPQR
jgi:hypothetical protein